ncbi:DUF3592 domain-containing protein [Hymenobacter sp. YC55]|nr:DUF3592 domain-containing protein [Hymenobacter sp. YC55]
MTIPTIPSDLQAALCLLLIGGLFLFRSGSLSQKRQTLLINGTEATATIVWLEDNPHSDRRTYYPVFRFQTRKQETITACYYHSKRRNGYRVGEQMQILYDPVDPTKFLVPLFTETEIWIYRVLGFGAGLLGLVTILLYAIL